MESPVNEIVDYGPVGIHGGYPASERMPAIAHVVLSTARAKLAPSAHSGVFHSTHRAYYYYHYFLYNYIVMYIRTVSLTNFRNYEHLKFEPAEGLNILVGPNAQGKSAILEGVYLLATSKSHRTSRDMDIIRIGENLARTCAHVIRTQRNDATLEIILSRQEKKTVRINKVKHPKVGDIVGQLNAVIFSNSDIDMVRGEPSLRRRFLNLEISQISPHYIYSLGRYKRVLDQRNNLLKEIKQGRARPKDLDMWDRQLAQYGADIILRRARFVGFLAKSAARIYSMLTENTEEFDIAYKPNFESNLSDSEKDIESRFAGLLASRRETDILRATTTTGPHRDDLSLMIAGMTAREFASQGQQRSAAIAMKLAEIDIIKESAEESPVVLLDDVMAELDETRRARILGITMDRCQTFVTTTSLDDVGSIAAAGTVFQVGSGKVTRV